MVEFNPMIDEKITKSKERDEIKKFLKKMLLFELESISAGIRYPYNKEMELEIKKYSLKCDSK